jgi:hypothetical protein
MSKQTQLKKKYIANFMSKWDNWRALLQTLVEEPAGQLICPTSRELTFEETPCNSIQVKLPYSICMYGIPQKLNRRCTNKIVVFIDGNYELEQKEENLRRIKSSIAFYKVDGKKLNLMDAYHFDFFDSLVEGHAPHPIFHAQRDIRCNEVEPRFNLALQNIPSLGHVTLTLTDASKKSKLFQFGAFRIPTPQMDIFNLGAVVVADQLVGHDCDKRWGHFKKLLESIHGAYGEAHHIKTPELHKAGIYKTPRKSVADWYLARA